MAMPQNLKRLAQLVLCRDRFLAGWDKSRLNSKNRDGSRRESRQRKAKYTAQNSENELG